MQARLLDTRPRAKTADGKFALAKLRRAGSVTELPVAGRGGVPRTGTSSVLLDVAVSSPARNGFVTLYPCGITRPGTSSLNYSARKSATALVIGNLNNAGKLCVYTSAAAHVTIDVRGFFPAVASGGIAPKHLLDTRVGSPTVDGNSAAIGALTPDTPVQMGVHGRGSLPSSGIGSVVLDVTLPTPTKAGTLTLYPCGTTPPLTPNITFRPGPTVSALLITHLGTDGKVCIVSPTPIDIGVDITGYFLAVSNTGSFAPARLLDTRPAMTTVDGAGAAIGKRRAKSTTEVVVVGRGGVPDLTVGGVAVDLTVENATKSGSITLYPCGSARPKVATMSFAAKKTNTRTVMALVGNGGKTCVYTSQAADVVVDVYAWSRLAPNQPNSNVTTYAATAAVVTSGGPGTGHATITITGTLPSVGDVIVTTTATGPYYGRVLSLSGSSVTTEEVALSDVIPEMDVSFSLDAAKKAARVKTTSNALGAVSVVHSDNLLPAGKFTCSADAGASITASVAADPGNFVFDVRLNRWKTGLDYARIGYNPYVTASLTVEAHANAKCDQRFNLSSVDLPMIQFSIYGVPVWITQKLDFALHFQESATAEISRTWSATASAWAGVTYSGGSWNREASLSLNASDKTSGKLGLQAMVELPITYTAKLYGIVGLHATLTPSLTLDYKPLEEKYLILTGQIDVTIGVELSLDLKLISFKYAHDFPTGTLIGPKQLWSREQPLPGKAFDCDVMNCWLFNDNPIATRYGDVNFFLTVHPDPQCDGNGYERRTTLTAIRGLTTPTRSFWDRDLGCVSFERNDPTTDAAGNIFFRYNYGRDSGVIVLVPTIDGFRSLGSLPRRSSGRDVAGKFFPGWTLGNGLTGPLDINTYDYDCNPNCADGQRWDYFWHWDGTAYVMELGD